MARQLAQVDALVEFTLATISKERKNGMKDANVSTSSQTPTYTARKRSRLDLENEELTSRIRSQLLHEPQHIILPASAEYGQLPPAKKTQIVSILNAIVTTYQNIDQED